MSNRILVFDTETSGKADFKRPPSDACQPFLVSLAAILVEGDEELACLNCIVDPGNRTIPVEASNIHGITTERARAVGLERAFVLHLFNEMAIKANWYVAHNISFDHLVMSAEFYRAELEFCERPHFCTMRNSTDICCLPGAFGWKWPKLSEVYQHAFHEPHIGAHGALADVRATLRVYRWLVNKLAERSLEPARA